MSDLTSPSSSLLLGFTLLIITEGQGLGLFYFCLLLSAIFLSVYFVKASALSEMTVPQLSSSGICDSTPSRPGISRSPQ